MNALSQSRMTLPSRHSGWLRQGFIKLTATAKAVVGLETGSNPDYRPSNCEAAR